jgi:DNA-binding protein H-NS
MPKTAQINLDALTVNQLAKLQAEIPTVIQRKTEQRQDAFRAKLARLAQDEGFDLHKLFGSAMNAPAVPAPQKPVVAKTANGVAVKYRDHKNPENTWTGRGREPRWLAALTKAGHKREEYRV